MKTIKRILLAALFAAFSSSGNAQLTPGFNLPIGTAIGEIAGAQPASTNLLKGTLNPGAFSDWTLVNTATKLASTANQYDSSYIPVIFSSLNGIADYIRNTSVTAAAAQPYTISGSFSVDPNFALTNPSSRLRLQIVWTGGVARTDYIDITPITGQLLASQNVLSFSSTPIDVILPTNVKARIYTVAFTVPNTPALTNAGEIRVYPLAASSGTGRVIAGGFQVENLSFPTSFINTLSGQTQTRYIGTIPSSLIRQITEANIIANGSAANPSLYWRTDTSTGFFRDGANQIGVSISGNKILDFLATGINVIGGITGTISGNGNAQSDVAPTTSILKGQNSFPTAAINTTGANTIIAPGIGTRSFTITNFAATGGKTVTLIFNGTTTVLTEGVDFQCVAAGSNNACALNLASAINTAIPTGLAAAQSTNNVNITLDLYVYSFSISTNAGAPLTANSGADGNITFAGSVALSSSTCSFTTTGLNNCPIGFTTANQAIFSQLTDSALTATRVPFSAVGGLLTDDATFTFNSTSKVLASSMFSGPIGGTGATPAAATVTTLAANTGASGNQITFGSTAVGYLFSDHSANVAFSFVTGGGGSALWLNATGATLYSPNQTKFAVISNTGFAVTGDISSSTGGAASTAACWKADGITLGKCSTTVGAGGGCTCG